MVSIRVSWLAPFLGRGVMYTSQAPTARLHYRLVRLLRHASTSPQQNYYQILELQPQASMKEIKAQFKKLLIKFHPDVNAHLSDAEKSANSDKYVEMVQAYETLKDKDKKREYDMNLGLTALSGTSRAEWHAKYYGEAKYYSQGRASGTYTSAGFRRSRVHNAYLGPGSDGSGTNNAFSGHHRNYGDRNDVPHFDYNEHLAKHLKFEQRIYGKQLTNAERESIIRQLARDGDTSNVSEELLTKHLMRQARRTGSTPHQATATALSNPYMYQGPQNGDGVEDSNLGLMTVLALGGAGSIYLLYHAFGGDLKKT